MRSWISTLNYRPQGETQWSCRTMAAATGVSKSTVQQVWSARGLRTAPGPDVQVVQRSEVRGEAGRCRGVVSASAGEGDRVVRRRKVLRSGPRPHPGIAADGQGPWRDDDPRRQLPRHGTTTLFAALDVLTGMIISQCQSRHRHQEWLKFLKTIDRQVPKDLQIHLILDNYATHQHEDRPPRSTNTPGSTSTATRPRRIVAQPRRTLVPGTDRQSIAARRLPRRARPRRLNSGIHRRPQQRPQTVRLDSHRRVHPRQSCARTDCARKSQLNTGHTR